jgi:AraC-like DNA-binding protein
MQDIIEISKRHVRKDGFLPTAIPSLEIVRSSAPSEPVPGVYRPSLCYVLQGTKEVVISGKTFRYSVGQYLVSSVDLPVTGEIIEATPSRPYLCLVVSLAPELIYEVLQSTTRQISAGTRSGIYVGRAEAALADAVARLARCLDSSDDGAVLVPGILKEIIYRLLAGPFGAMIAEMGMAGSRTQRISRAITHLKNKFAEPLRVTDLARLSGMSPSTFHEHFRRITTMSPLQYQKLLRLQEARRLLVSDGAGAGDIGFRVGYQSPSQFSREYSRYFGRPPSVDLRARRV